MKKKLLALSVLAAVSSQSNAFQVMSNDDWDIRWDNSFKFNVISRLNKPSDEVNIRADGYWLADDANLSVDRSNGGLVSTRIDVLSELDVIWRDNFGFRVSGSAWYDPQYKSDENDHPRDRNYTWGAPSAGTGYFSDDAEDLHYLGGELLDAFVFANFEFGDVALGARAGRHTIYWGNSLLATGAVVSIGGAMAPLDFSKALSVPGSEAKELFMPTNKLSTVVQLTDNLTFNAYYSLEHMRYRLPESGTFFSPAEGLTENQEFTPFPPLPRGTYSAPARTGFLGRGDKDEDDEWGVNFQYFIESWGLETSFIYLNYVDKNLHSVLAGSDLGQLGTVAAGAGDPTAIALMTNWNALCEPLQFACPNAPYPIGDGTAIVTGQGRWLFKEDLDLWGISFAKEIAGISFGLDLVYRPDTPVAIGIGPGLARAYNAPDSPLFPSGDEIVQALGLASYIPGDYNSYDSKNFLGPIGDVYTVIFNGIGLLQDNGIWEGGSYIFEFTGQMMDECTGDCFLIDPRVLEDRVVTTVAGVFNPTWYQVLPGWDLSVPMSVSYTIDGEKSPFTFGGDEDRGSASIGAEFLVNQKWTMRAQYNTYFGPVNAGLGGLLKDRDNVSFTVKRTF